MFITNERVFFASGNYTAKIIDFDRSVFIREKIIPSTGLSGLCKDYGVCPEENRARDPVIFLTFTYSNLLGKTTPKKVLEFMDDFVDKISSEPDDMIRLPTSKYKKVAKGFLCLQDGKCKNWVPSKELLNDFSQMVEKNVFELEVMDMKTKKDLTLVAEKQVSYCGRLFMGLDVQDEKRKVLIKRTEFPF